MIDTTPISATDMPPGDYAIVEALGHRDLFHDAVPDEWIDRVFAVCALTPQHTHMILTKRSARMREYFASLKSRSDPFAEGADEIADALGMKEHPAVPEPHDFPLPNVWLGVSVEDQTRADERIPDLLATPAAVRFISAEPLLGSVDLQEWLICPNARDGLSMDPSTGAYECCRNCDWTGLIGGLDWVIVGGESGPKARPMHPDWARSLRDQCLAAGVAFHFKQWGEWAPVSEMAEEMIDGCYHPAPERQPDATRRCRVDQCVLHRDGERFDGKAMFERPAFEQGRGAMTMMAIGKKRAGRLLDGREWNEAPPAGESV